MTTATATFGFAAPAATPHAAAPRAASPFSPFCIGCGSKVPPLRACAIACPHCGDELIRADGTRATASRATPALRALASLVLPGAGQAWNGQIGKAVLVLLTSPLIVPWIWGVCDAWRVARRRARAPFLRAQ
jgi:predicted RNA-binding Zn-ribbon protein involved in translation (DUF1610 family)